MFSKEVLILLKEVISSWQVLVVTIVLIFFLNIVFYTARAYHRPKIKLKDKISFRIKKSKSRNAEGIAEEIPDSNQKDELGLEES